MDDISDATQAATIAAGNNAVFAMGAGTAGKFQRKVAAKRVQARVRLEVKLHEDDNSAIVERLQLQKTVSHSRYADKVAAKRAAAGLDAGDFHARSARSASTARSREKTMAEVEHAKVAAGMAADAAHEGKFLDDMLAAQQAKSRRMYATTVRNKRVGKGMNIGAFARSTGIVDPLVDLLAVSKFMSMRTVNYTMATEHETMGIVNHHAHEHQEETRAPESARTLEQDLASLGIDDSNLGLTSGKIELPAAILAATAPSRRWVAPRQAFGGAASARSVLGMLAPQPPPGTPVRRGGRLLAVTSAMSSEGGVQAEEELRQHERDLEELEAELGDGGSRGRAKTVLWEEVEGAIGGGGGRLPPMNE